jgi:hypothetical protein
MYSARVVAAKGTCGSDRERDHGDRDCDQSDNVSPPTEHERRLSGPLLTINPEYPPPPARWWI